MAPAIQDNRPRRFALATPKLRPGRAMTFALAAVASELSFIEVVFS